MSFSADYIYRIKDRYSSQLERITKTTKRFQDVAGRAALKADRLGKNLDKVGRRARDIGGTLTTRLTLPIMGLGIMAGKTAIDMQSGFIGVQKTVDASAEQLAVMRERFKKLSTEIPVSVNELFRIGEAAGQLGIETDRITSFTKTIAMLGATTNIAGDEGATQLARFANITQMSQEHFDRLGSTIVHLGNNLATTEAEISEMALRLAASGNVVGMSEHQILSLAGAAKSVGLNAEAGGTAFSRTMLKINDAVDKGGSMLSMFARVSGQTSAEFAKKFKTDAAGVLIDFTEGLGRLRKEGKNVGVILEKLTLNDIRVRDAMLRAAGAGDTFRKALVLGATAWEENNALTKEAALRFGSWGSQLTIAWNKLKLVSNELGKILVPAFIKLMDIVVPILEKFNGLSRTSKIVILVLSGLAAVIPPLLVGFGMLAMAASYLIPVITFLAGSMAGLFWPITAGVLAVGTMIAIFATAYKRSAAFRQSLANLADAFSPVVDALKVIGRIIGKQFGMDLKDSANDFKVWGDILANVINFIAGMIQKVFQIAGGVGTALGAISMGNFGDAWSAIKEGIGTAPAKQKSDARFLKSKQEINGRIDISTSGGAKVDNATIGLNTGSNLVGAILAGA
jgi:TP901 family phage tail tape measure protein